MPLEITLASKDIWTKEYIVWLTVTLQLLRQDERLQGLRTDTKGWEDEWYGDAWYKRINKKKAEKKALYRLAYILIYEHIFSSLMMMAKRASAPVIQKLLIR